MERVVRSARILWQRPGRDSGTGCKSTIILLETRYRRIHPIWISSCGRVPQACRTGFAAPKKVDQ